VTLYLVVKLKNRQKRATSVLFYQDVRKGEKAFQGPRASTKYRVPEPGKVGGGQSNEGKRKELTGSESELTRSLKRWLRSVQGLVEKKKSQAGTLRVRFLGSRQGPKLKSGLLLVDAPHLEKARISHPTSMNQPPWERGGLGQSLKGTVGGSGPPGKKGVTQIGMNCAGTARRERMYKIEDREPAQREPICSVRWEKGVVGRKKKTRGVSRKMNFHRTGKRIEKFR